MDNKRKIFRIVMGILWFVIGVKFFISSKFLNSVIFFLCGAVFLGSAFKGKKE